METWLDGLVGAINQIKWRASFRLDRMGTWEHSITETFERDWMATRANYLGLPLKHVKSLVEVYGSTKPSETFPVIQKQIQCLAKLFEELED